ncbi:MAG: hypothetical protein L3J33_07080 [Rhodobacteraceae bacterium]|nr:hypothetical protein [Paracoccaceae bacterium]
MIAVICPVHRNPEVVEAQIKNYSKFHGENAVHILHPSVQSQADFSKIPSRLKDSCDVRICDKRWPTSYRTVLGAAISATKMIDKMDNNFQYVYFHTDADLLVSGNLTETIKKYKNGYLCRRPHTRWHPLNVMLADENFLKIRNLLCLDQDDIRAGRQEGCFFEIDVWREMMSIITRYYSKAILADEKSHWPFEAVLFPTLARLILGRESPPRRNIVQTKNFRTVIPGTGLRDIQANMVKIEDIIRVRNRNRYNECIGMKWFSTDLNHVTRKFLESE